MRFLTLFLWFFCSLNLFSQKKEVHNGVDSIVVVLSNNLHNNPSAHEQLKKIKASITVIQPKIDFNFELYDHRLVKQKKDVEKLAHFVSKYKKAIDDETLLKFYTFELQFLLDNNIDIVPKLKSFTEFAAKTQLFKSVNNNMYRYRGLEILFASYHQIGAFEKMKSIALLLVELAETEAEIKHFYPNAKLAQSISLAYDENFDFANNILDDLLNDVDKSSELHRSLLFSQTINFFHSGNIDSAKQNLPELVNSSSSINYPKHINLCIEVLIALKEIDLAQNLLTQYEETLLENEYYTNWYYPHVSIMNYFDSTNQLDSLNKLIDRIHFPDDFYNKINPTNPIDLSLLIFKYKRSSIETSLTCEEISVMTRELKFIHRNLKTPVEWISYPKDLDNYLRSLMIFFEFSLEINLTHQDSCRTNDATLAFDVIEFSKNIEFFTRFSDEFVKRKEQNTEKETPTFYLGDKNIRADKMYLNYFYGDKNIYCLRLLNKALKLFKVAETSSIESQLFDFIHEIHQTTSSIRFKNAAETEANVLLYQERALLIFNKIVAPLIESNAIQDWVIYPDELLHFLPFDALIQEANECAVEWGELNYLMLTHNIHYINNLKSLFYSDTSDKAIAPSILAVKHDRSRLNPLKSNEIKFIKKSFSNVFQVNNTFFKSTSAFIDAVEAHSIVILSMHSYMPKASNTQIFMDFGHFELYPSDIMNKDLRSELIVLGSCMSSVGKQLRGWGSLSLPNSFEFAGIKSQIGMIWAIDDDASARIIEETINLLESGEVLSQSLTKAKRKYLNEGNYFKKHPFYWAAAKSFALDQSIEFPARKGKGNSKQWIIWALMLVVLISGGIYTIKKRSSH